MKSNLKPRFLIAGLILIICLAFSILNTKSASAQEIGIGIYPPVLQIDTTPPSSIKANIVVQNQTDQTNIYSIYLEPFTAANSYNGVPQFDSTLIGEYQHFFKNVQVFDGDHTIRDVKLAPNQKKSLILHIGLNKGEKPQDYYFTVLFLSDGGAKNAGSSFSQATGGVGTNVLLSIGPKSPAAGQITEFSSPGFVTQGPVNFKLQVENSGNSYFAPRGNVLIRNMFGQTIGQIDLLPVNILSDSKRYIPSKDNKDLNNPKAVWKEKFLLGIYTAKATISLSDQGPVVTKTTTFFAFPLEGLLVLIAGVLICIGIIKRVKAKRKELS